MEGYCSTGQSPQRAVVPVEEEEINCLLFSFLLSIILSLCLCTYLKVKATLRLTASQSIRQPTSQAPYFSLWMGCHSVICGVNSDESTSLSSVISHRLWRSFEHILRPAELNHTQALTAVRLRSNPEKHNTKKHNTTHWNNFLFLNFSHRSNILIERAWRFGSRFTLRAKKRPTWRAPLDRAISLSLGSVTENSTARSSQHIWCFLCLKTEAQPAYETPCVTENQTMKRVPPPKKKNIVSVGHIQYNRQNPVQVLTTWR
jgi:hypothetical protein